MACLVGLGHASAAASSVALAPRTCWCRWRWGRPLTVPSPAAAAAVGHPARCGGRDPPSRRFAGSGCGSLGQLRRFSSSDHWNPQTESLSHQRRAGLSALCTQAQRADLDRNVGCRTSTCTHCAAGACCPSRTVAVARQRGRVGRRPTAARAGWPPAAAASGRVDRAGALPPLHCGSELPAATTAPARRRSMHPLTLWGCWGEGSWRTTRLAIGYRHPRTPSVRPSPVQPMEPLETVARRDLHGQGVFRLEPREEVPKRGRGAARPTRRFVAATIGAATRAASALPPGH